MHIHPSSPNSDISLQSEVSAAIKIQAGFRGYRVRKQLRSRQQTRNSNHGYQVRNSSLRRQKRYQQQAMSKMQVFLGDGVNTASAQLCNQGNSGSESASVEDRCATKIQAGVRGFLVRKKQKMATDAATKIQAGFRGFKGRKEAQKLKEQ